MHRTGISRRQPLQGTSEISPAVSSEICFLSGANRLDPARLEPKQRGDLKPFLVTNSAHSWLEDYFDSELNLPSRGARPS